jgi:aspartate kinase
MKVFKFGGASVKDAEAVRNVGQIIQRYNDDLVVVISAMGKITNLLETLVKAYFENDNKKWDILQQFKNYHTEITDQLFDNNGTPEAVAALFTELEMKLKKRPSFDYNF